MEVDIVEEVSDEEVKKVVKEHGGMISRDMAREVLTGKNRAARRIGIEDLNSEKVEEGEVVSMEENVYRVFNKVRFEKDGRTGFRRSLILGNGSSNARVTLWDKQAELVDGLAMEKGDRVLATNLRVRKGLEGLELSSMGNTYFSRVVPSRGGITDFSLLNAGDKNLDVIGRIVSLGRIRYFADLDGKQGGVSDGAITDGRIELRLVMWRSSSACAAGMHPGDYVKIEHASVRETSAGKEISANDSSRVLVSNALRGRIAKV